MATSLLEYDAASFRPDATNPPLGGSVQDRNYWAFDDTTEQILFTLGRPMPQAYAGGTLTAYITYWMAGNNTSKVVRWGVAVEAITEGDAAPVMSTGSDFDTANVANDTCDDDLGIMNVAAVTLTNKGATNDVAVGDMFRLKVYRDADALGDNAEGDACLVSVEIREA